MPHLAGPGGGLFYRAAGAFAAPHLARFLDVDRAVPAGEWVARVVLSYTFWPADDVDLTDETATRGFVRSFLLPALDHDQDPSMSATEDLIGRTDINDLEAILSITNRDVDEMAHAVKDNADAIFTWDYEKGARPALNKLYEKAKTAQWNGETDLPWDTEVDQEKVVLANAAANNGLQEGVDLTGHAVREVDRRRVAPRSASSSRTGSSPSSCTASRARCCAPRRSSRPCRGSTPSTTRPRR